MSFILTVSPGVSWSRWPAKPHGKVLPPFSPCRTMRWLRLYGQCYLWVSRQVNHGAPRPNEVLWNALKLSSEKVKLRSAQIGITVHGTHRSLVESNVMWDVSAAGIYTEDGNEMFNTLSPLPDPFISLWPCEEHAWHFQMSFCICKPVPGNNVIICSWHEKCSGPWDVQLNNAAGIYMLLDWFGALVVLKFDPGISRVLCCSSWESKDWDDK